MISVLVPAYNEEENLEALYVRVSACAATWNEPWELVVVDDGSRDATPAICQRLAAADQRFRTVTFARNFGHQAAVTAALEHASGDVVAIIDADLQDPPEELPRFIAKCREGHDVVYAVRTQRKEGMFLRASYHLYYRLLASLANVDIPLDSGDFCVMSRRAVDILNALPERRRFVRGLRSWIGFSQVGLSYERAARAAGAPKYTFRKLLGLALDGIFNFSYRPLRIIGLTGIAVGMLALAAGAVFLFQYVTDTTIAGYNPRQARGWTSLILAVLFLAGVQLFSIGILGEYVGRLFDEAKRRPVYVVARRLNLAEPGAAASAREG